MVAVLSTFKLGRDVDVPFARIFAFVALASVSACALLVDTDGLTGADLSDEAGPSGGEAGPFGDAGRNATPDDADLDADAPRCAAPDPDCGDACAPEDPDACGPSCSVCPALEGSVATCNQGACGFSCAPAFADCNGEPADQCEIDTNRDPENCGACGHGCAGRACSGGVCDAEIVHTGASDPGPLVVDGAKVYWLDRGSGTVFAKAKDGSGAPLALVTTSFQLQHLTQTPTEIYFTAGINVSTVGRVPKKGGASVELSSKEYYPYTIAVDDERVYWGGDSTNGKVRQWSSGTSSDFTEADTGSGPLRIAIDDATVYWGLHKEIRKKPKSGGTMEKVALDEAHYVEALALDKTDIYYCVNKRVRRINKAGGEATTLGQYNGKCEQLAVDDAHVFWASRSDGSVWRANKTGAPSAFALAIGRQQPIGIAVDDTYVYFTSAGDGTVERVAK